MRSKRDFVFDLLILIGVSVGLFSAPGVVINACNGGKCLSSFEIWILALFLLLLSLWFWSCINNISLNIRFGKSRYENNISKKLFNRGFGRSYAWELIDNNQAIIKWCISNYISADACAILIENEVTL